MQLSAATPLLSDNLVDEVVGRLKAHIVSGQLAAEAPLPSEGRLAESFRVSRTVVREAMRILRTQGLVEITQGRRPRVKRADPQATIESLDALLSRSTGSLAHLTEARRPLEIEIAGLAAERATAEQLESLAGANRELAAATSLEQAVIGDVRFHRLLAEATGNPIFVLVLETIAQLLLESRRRTIAASGQALALEEHQKILATIVARDALAARAAMAQHMRLIERDLAGAGQAPSP
ncbi:MAG: FCD domain-containing protein [Pirellulaceae bacterium]|nr:FCD domain-containing protein [Pirellulaceae bacterium]